MSVKESVERYGVGKLIDALYKDPEKNLPRMMDWADRMSGENFDRERRMVRSIIENPDDPYYGFIRRLFTDVDKNVLCTSAVDLFVNSVMVGWNKQQALRDKYKCNIPWTILLDPTSACNLHCTGCWAAEYGNRLNLSVDEIDDIICQGKELGVYFYIYTGGEPLTRRWDLMEIAKRHSDCVFMCFTNGTLIDDKFADALLEVGNFVPVISLEGSREATDGRRGQGTYDKVMKALDLLHDKKLLYGISSCYTSANYESITSDTYLDMLVEKGVYFIWYFHYMPVGADASLDLLPTPEQRKGVYDRIRAYRANHPLFAMDFQNDAEYVGGCIAGGRRYLHINAKGDMDPCVFIHYSDSNIREKTLLEGLRSPLFQAYHDGQPFNDNMLRPCPMLENPQLLRGMVAKSQAHSTDPEAPLSVEDQCAKCDKYAQNWQPVADEMWQKRQLEKHRLHCDEAPAPHSEQVV
jgi:MoaA/NifB/PqqE/SkfB family radical SAM enzyme